MTKRELTKLKNKLPVGYREALARQTELSIVSIDKILSGDRTNIKVIKAALELAKAHQDELNQISSEIKTL